MVRTRQTITRSVGDGDDRLALGRFAPVAAVACHVPEVKGPQVALVADGGPGDLDQNGLEVGLPCLRLPEYRLPAGSWLPGQTPAQDARCPGRTPAGGGADLADHRRRGRGRDPGDSDQEVAGGAKPLHHRLDPASSSAIVLPVPWHFGEAGLPWVPGRHRRRVLCGRAAVNGRPGVDGGRKMRPASIC